MAKKEEKTIRAEWMATDSSETMLEAKGDYLRALKAKEQTSDIRKLVAEVEHTHSGKHLLSIRERIIDALKGDD